MKTIKIRLLLIHLTDIADRIFRFIVVYLISIHHFVLKIKVTVEFISIGQNQT